MKLERLEISGFGRLRDVVIDFSPRLTLILGDNESGKSTVHRAIRAALYGLDAGGPGRPVERSEWSRWRPWTPGPYGVVLTYSLESGARFRVARRLDQRAQSVQVQELGGGDVTAAMREGRSVTPGRQHLGIDEAVFCATAWLGDDGLRMTSPEGPSHRPVSVRLQEAIERLADSGRGVTAANAVARLREAMARVGSERRSATPLGVATARLRQLDHEIEAARRRANAIAADQARLVHLQATAATAAELSLRCERAWLIGRLARIAVERADLAAAAAEATQLRATIAENRAFAGFPLDDEERVLALGGEHNQASATAAEAEARWNVALPELQALRRRRGEIAGGLEAMGTPISLEDPALKEAHGLELELATETGVARSTGETRRAEAGCEQLRRQIAATGLAAIPSREIEALAPLFRRAMGTAGRAEGVRAAAALTAGAAVGTAAQISGRGALALIALVIGAGLAVVFAALSLIGGEQRRARRQLHRQCPGLDVSAEGIEIAATRLPTLQRLQDELQRWEALVHAHRLEVEAVRARTADLSRRCAAVAVNLGLSLPMRCVNGSEPNGIEEHRATALAALSLVNQAVEERRCWDDLVQEDERLAIEEQRLLQMMEEAARCRGQVHEIEERLGHILGRAGLGPELECGDAVTQYREACEGRRRHADATARLAEVERRVAAIGSDEATLTRRADDFAQDLRDRGGSPDEARAATPLGAAHLAALEREVDRARTDAATASEQAASLAARLNGAMEGLPCIAELADERSSCAAARERGLQQIAGLERAISLIGSATKHVHRDLAPRLAESVADRLCLITDGRYRSVNVDTEHFAVSLMSRERSEVIPLELVSRGTRDQVSLLLRLALTELLGDRIDAVPLLLDEPLLSSDRGRTHQALEFLSKLSSSHQVVVTSSDMRMAQALRGEADDEGSVIALEGVPVAMPMGHPTPVPG